jgi:(2Fe-2S) ferredoxin
VLLVRRTGRRGAPADRGWWVLRGHRPAAPAGGVVASGRWAGPDDLLAAVAVDEQAPARPAGLDVPRLLVCTHGRHDTCCAVRGRPVAEALARRWPQATWECTHLGGDRFAANLLVVPDGTTYGAVDGTDPVRLVQEHLAGRVDAVHLRGWSHLHPWEQAAAVHAHREGGPLPLGAVVVHPARTEHVVASQRWRVHLDVGPVPQVLDVRAEPAPPALLTCRAASQAVAVRYRVAPG